MRELNGETPNTPIGRELGQPVDSTPSTFTKRKDALLDALNKAAARQLLGPISLAYPEARVITSDKEQPVVPSPISKEEQAFLTSHATNEPIDPLEQTVNTSPTGQRILENFEKVAGGYYVPAMAGGAYNLAKKGISALGKKAASIKELKALAAEGKVQPLAQIPEATVPKIEAYIKGTMGGGISPNTGKPLPVVNIYGVRGDKEALAKMGWSDVGSVPEAELVAKGIKLPEAPVKEEVATQMNLFKRNPQKGKPTEPMYFSSKATPESELTTAQGEQLREKWAALTKEQTPLNPQAESAYAYPDRFISAKYPRKPLKSPELTPAEKPAPEVIKAPEPPKLLPEGAETRIKALTEASEKDVPEFAPTVTSAEQVANVGTKAQGPLRDTLQTGLKTEALAEEAFIKKSKDLLTKYKIKPESKESEAIVAYSKIKKDNPLAAEAALHDAFGTDGAQRIMQSEKELRTLLDTYYTDVNKVRAVNNMPLIPYREDYFTAIKEYNVLNTLGLTEKIGTEEGVKLANDILTASEQIKASKFGRALDVAFNHIKRQTGSDKDDAISSFITYARDAERFMALQPHVNELNSMAKAVEKTMPNLARSLRDRADFIAGKEQPIDAAVKNLIGTEAFNALVKATSIMKGNLIEGNPSVPLSQLFAFPSINSNLEVMPAVKGALKAATDSNFRNFLVANSPTLRLRFAAQDAKGLAQSKARSLLSAPSEFVDTSTLLYSLGGKYLELIKKGVAPEEAMAQAEQFASLTQATLSKLNTAPALRSQVAQTSVPFMNQVLSQSKFVTTQMLKGKTFAGKMNASAKFLATGAALAGAIQLLAGEDAKSPLDPEGYIPFGSALTQGVGGPVFSGAGRIIKAEGLENKLLQVFRTAMLLQNKIPAGLTTSKIIESLFKEGE